MFWDIISLMGMSGFGIDIEKARENFRKREEARFQERERHRNAARTAILRAIAEIAPHYPDLTRVYIYGSITMPGWFVEGSDIDLGVEGLDPEGYYSMWHELEGALPDWFVDLRRIDTPSHFSERVKSSGELVFER